MLRINLLVMKGIVLLALILFFGAICFGSFENAIAQTCEGDLNCDCRVDFDDYLIFASEYGDSDCHLPPRCTADLNSDTVVDYNDYLIFAAEYGRTDCP